MKDTVADAAANGQNGTSVCAGACPDLSADGMIALASSQCFTDIPAVRLFLAKYRTFPSTLKFGTKTDDICFHVPTILNYLRDDLKHDIAKDCIVRKYHGRTDKLYIESRTSDLGRGVIIEFVRCDLEADINNPNKYPVDAGDDHFLQTSAINIHYVPEQDELAQDLFTRFSAMTVFKLKSCSLGMVCRKENGYYIRGIKINKPLITDMALHYGSRFVPVHEKILASLNKKESKGIVLLHGIPGSGKTHYIRYLIQEITDKKLIYIPPDMAKEISSPAFLPFLMEYPDSILIIEDAENIIKDRNETLVPSQAVANLLNLSDGLLGDAMRQQIIATFNCDLTTIDPALLRKGRLIANHQFDKLDLESSRILSEKLGYGTDGVTEPMTLAEIFNQGGEEKPSSALSE